MNLEQKIHHKDNSMIIIEKQDLVLSKLDENKNYYIYRVRQMEEGFFCANLIKKDKICDKITIVFYNEVLAIIGKLK